MAEKLGLARKSQEMLDKKRGRPYVVCGGVRSLLGELVHLADTVSLSGRHTL